MTADAGSLTGTGTGPGSGTAAEAPGGTVKAKQSLASRLVEALSGGLVRVFLIVVALFWLVPTIGLLLSSLRTPQDMAASGWWNVFTEPSRLTFQSYEELLKNGDITSSLLNTALITVPATVLVVVIGALAGYAFAWMDFPGRDWWFLAVVGLLVVPVQVALIPIAELFGKIGLFGSMLGVILFHVGFGLPFAVFLLRNFFAEIPRELLEAARLDGAGELRLFARVVMPLGGPAIASLGIFQFLWVWNDMLVALIFSDSDSQPITVALQTQVRQFGNNIDVLAPGGVHLHGDPAGRVLRVPAAVRLRRDGGRRQVADLAPPLRGRTGHRSAPSSVRAQRPPNAPGAVTKSLRRPLPGRSPHRSRRPMDVPVPRFSVIVPAYQVQAYLHACLESVLAQSYPDFEVIVVDDCSPDACGAIADEFAALDPRVRVVRLPRNEGLGPARNAGMERASGDYLVFLDGDDTLTEHALRSIADRIKETGEPDVLVYDYARTPGARSRSWYRAPGPRAPHRQQPGAPPWHRGPRRAPPRSAASWCWPAPTPGHGGPLTGVGRPVVLSDVGRTRGRARGRRSCPGGRTCWSPTTRPLMFDYAGLDRPVVLHAERAGGVRGGPRHRTSTCVPSRRGRSHGTRTS
ncbi:hypothetical protein STENM223S_03304 [Streptomyces tendae]